MIDLYIPHLLYADIKLPILFKKLVVFLRERERERENDIYLVFSTISKYKI